MIATADITRMSLDERLQTIELLCQSLSSTQAHIPSPHWHHNVLADRLARAKTGQAQFLSLEEAKDRLSQT